MCGECEVFAQRPSKYEELSKNQHGPCSPLRDINIWANFCSHLGVFTEFLQFVYEKASGGKHVETFNISILNDFS